MPQDILKSGLAWLTGQLAEHAAQDVTYVRDSSRVAVRATFGPKLLRLDDGEGGSRTEWTDLDFCIPAASLVLDGETIAPRTGDRVLVPDPAGTAIYEVRPYMGEPAWRWADPHRSMVRVHTKHVETERET